MNEPRFGDYLRDKIREQGYTEVELAKELGFEYSSTVSRWITNVGAPKLDSPYIKMIVDFLHLSEHEQEVLEKAQISFHLTKRNSPASAAVRKFLQEAQLKETVPAQHDRSRSAGHLKSRVIRGRKEIVEIAASMLADVPEVKGDPRPEILISSQGGERLESPLFFVRPLVWGAQKALKRGWAVRGLWRLDGNATRTVGLIKDMLESSGTGRHYPEYITSYGTLVAPYDLLVIPGIAALACFAADNARWVDSALLVRDAEEIRLLADHFEQLRTGAKPLLTSYLPHQRAEYWEALEAAENSSAKRGVVKDGVSTFLWPTDWYQDDSFLSGCIREQGLDWRRFQAYGRNHIATFTTALAGSSTSYREICPKRAIERFVKEGHYRANPAASASFWAPPEKREEQLLRLIFLLEHYYPRFELALLEEIEEKHIATTPFWEVTSTGVFMEAWTPDAAREKEIEISVQIEEPTVVRAFGEYFDDLWKRISPTSKDKAQAIEWLHQQIMHIPTT